MPEQREHRPEAGDVGDGVAHGRPARRRRRAALRRDGDRGELAEVRGHERQDARREERDQARERPRRGTCSRPSCGSPARAPSRTSASRRRSLAGARRELELAVAEGHDRDRERVPALEVVVALDAALHERRRRQAARPAVRQDGLERRARVLAQVAAGAAVQDEVGEGSGHDADCRSRAGFGRCTGRGRARRPAPFLPSSLHSGT